MDDEPRFGSEFHPDVSRDEDSSSLNRYSGAFFPRAKHFVVEGGKFKSVTHIHQAAANAPPDFRIIPIGDLNLLHQLELCSGSGVVRRRHGRTFVRRMYSAHIQGCKSNMAVTLYQGDGAKDRWKEDISQYSELRHPYLAQLYGIVSTANLHAVVFHDDLIPYTELLEKYRNSHLSTVYFWACMDSDFSDVDGYISSLSGTSLPWEECTAWIRPSTGRLCLDHTPPETNPLAHAYVYDVPRPPGTSLCKPPAEAEMITLITSMSLHDYHEICYWHPSRERSWPISTDESVKLGSIRHRSGPEYENSLEVASGDCTIYDFGWSTRNPTIEDYLLPIICGQEGTFIMVNSWIRINSAEVVHEYGRRMYNMDASHWLAQANDIFNRLDMTWGFEDFVSVHAIDYWLELSIPTDNPPPGYLFLCPLAELQAEDPTCFRVPDRPAYWSLDPSGIDRLSVEAAENLGFPAIELQIKVSGKSWDASVYGGIRQFHQYKGFDTYSQQVPLEMGYPPVRVPCDWDTVLAHLQQSDNGDCYSDSDGVSCTKDVSESAVEKFDVEIDNEMNDHTPEDIPPAKEDLSTVPKKSVPSSYQCCTLEEAEMLAPSLSFNIVMAVQFVLILTATALSLYDYFHPRS